MSATPQKVGLTPIAEVLHDRFMETASDDHQGMEDLCSEAIEKIEELERSISHSRKTRALLSDAVVALHHVYVSTGKPAGMCALIDKIDDHLRGEPFASEATK